MSCRVCPAGGWVLGPPSQVKGVCDNKCSLMCGAVCCTVLYDKDAVEGRGGR